jgi:hypothetical protein
MATEASGPGPDTSQDGLLAMELQAAEQSMETMSDEELVEEETLEAACARHAEENRIDDQLRARRALAEQTRAAKVARDAEFVAQVEGVRMQVVAELVDAGRVWLLAGVYGKVPSVAACIDDVGALNEAAGVLARARCRRAQKIQQPRKLIGVGSAATRLTDRREPAGERSKRGVRAGGSDLRTGRGPGSARARRGKRERGQRGQQPPIGDHTRSAQARASAATSLHL